MACSLSAGLPVSVGEDLELGLLVAELHLVVFHVTVLWAVVDDHRAALLGRAQVGLLDAVQDLLLLLRTRGEVVSELSVEIISGSIGVLFHSTAMILRLKGVLHGMDEQVLVRLEILQRHHSDLSKYLPVGCSRAARSSR